MTEIDNHHITMESIDSHASGWEDDESLRRGHVAVSEEEKDWRIALYYCYVPIEDVPEHVEFQSRLCGESSLGLMGRIRVSPGASRVYIIRSLESCQPTLQ